MKVILIVWLVNIYCLHCSSTLSPKLNVNLLNSGFHRDLKYVTVFSEFHGKSYSYLLKQKLPAGVYVSTDQLEDLKRFEKINYYVDEKRIDIEKPMEQSKPFFIYLFGDTGLVQPIILPIHFRYHAPANKSFVTVDIPFPQLFIETDHSDVVENTTIIHSYLCKDLRHRCKWIEIEYENYSKKPVSANIPIGNASLSGIITYATIALSWIASLFIILVIRNKSKLLKNKLK